MSAMSRRGGRNDTTADFSSESAVDFPDFSRFQSRPARLSPRAPPAIVHPEEMHKPSPISNGPTVRNIGETRESRVVFMGERPGESAASLFQPVPTTDQGEICAGKLVESAERNKIRFESHYRGHSSGNRQILKSCRRETQRRKGAETQRKDSTSASLRLCDSALPSYCWRSPIARPGNLRKTEGAEIAEKRTGERDRHWPLPQRPLRFKSNAINAREWGRTMEGRMIEEMESRLFIILPPLKQLTPVRRGSPDPAETPDRRSPLRASRH